MPPSHPAPHLSPPLPSLFLLSLHITHYGPGMVFSTLSMQVVGSYFSSDGNRSVSSAARTRIRDAIVATQWADVLPRILTVVDQHNLVACQDADYAEMHRLAYTCLAPENLSALTFTQAAGVIHQLTQVCGVLSAPEKLLFEKILGCTAFWNFVVQHGFYGE